METRAVEKSKTHRPVLFDGGWMEKFLNAPIDEFFNTGRIMNIPAVNVAETEKDFRLTFASPGMDKKDFKVEAYDDILTITAEKEQKLEKNGHYNRREYNYSSWSRSFTLPENCDASRIDASYSNGELKLVIPKKEVKETHKIKSITVN